ncbi:MAG: myo-inosose-2 dehydratase [Alphaproteobacteria bacterium]|nr:myo-inosose-2 dehydratase [Alphaproteobacteria bacterium]
MSVRIGINPLTWTNDDMPELGGETPLDTCLAEAKLAGYDGIELGNKFPREGALLAPILNRHGLALASGWYGARLLERDVDSEMAAAEAHLTLLLELGCKVCVFAEVSGSVHGARNMPLSVRPVMSGGQWALLAERMGETARRMRARGLHLAYHHHLGTVVETEAEIDRLMAATGPEVGLLFDTGHLSCAGGDPAAIAARHAGRIVHVHCKDVRADRLRAARARDASFLDAVLNGMFTVPGDGAVDYRAALAPLARAGYRGWLIVEAEQDPAKAHPLTYARMGRIALGAVARELWPG